MCPSYSGPKASHCYTEFLHTVSPSEWEGEMLVILSHSPCKDSRLSILRVFSLEISGNSLKDLFFPFTDIFSTKTAILFSWLYRSVVGVYEVDRYETYNSIPFGPLRRHHYSSYLTYLPFLLAYLQSL